MTYLIEAYLAEVDRRLTVEPTQRAQVLSELRQHLAEKVADLKRTEPGLPDEEVQRRVTSEFGSPDDLALAYNPAGSVVLTDAAGAIIMTFSAAVTKAGRAAGKAVGQGAKAVGRGASWLGRGAGRFLKIAFLGLVILLGSALLSASIVAVFLFDDIRDTVYDNIENDIYGRSLSCDGRTCDGAGSTQRFYVPDGVRELGFRIHASVPRDAGNGTAQLRILDPSGGVVFDDRFPPHSGRSVYEEGNWAPVPGYWTVELTFDGYPGWVSVDVWTRGGLR